MAKLYVELTLKFEKPHQSIYNSFLIYQIQDHPKTRSSTTKSKSSIRNTTMANTTKLLKVKNTTRNSTTNTVTQSTPKQNITRSTMNSNMMNMEILFNMNIVSYHFKNRDKQFLSRCKPTVWWWYLRRANAQSGKWRSYFIWILYFLS